MHGGEVVGLAPQADALAGQLCVVNAVQQSAIHPHIGLVRRAQLRAKLMQGVILAVFFQQKTQLDLWPGLLPKGLLLRQHAGQPGAWQRPDAGGVQWASMAFAAAQFAGSQRFACLWRAHQVLHAPVLQVGQPGLGAQWLARQQTRAGVHHIQLAGLQQFAQAMAVQTISGRFGLFKAGVAVGGLIGVGKVTQGVVKHPQIGAGHGARAMATHTTSQLNQGAHGRRLGQRPVHAEIPAGFTHWRRQHHKQLVGFWVAVQAVANIGAGKYGVGLATVQRAIQLLFDGGAQQQRKLRVIHAQMQAQASRCAQAK